MNNSIILLSGGVGKRFSAELPKQFYKIFDKTIMEYTLDNVIKIGFEKVVIVANKEYIAKHLEVIEKYKKLPSCANVNISIVEGGEERYDSVISGLSSIDEEYVFIHDIVRPFVSSKMMKSFFEILDNYNDINCVVPYINMEATVRKITDIDEGQLEFIDRDKLIVIQTPQLVNRDKHLALLEKATDTEKKSITDDSSIYMLKGLPIHRIYGDKDNKKITTKEDISHMEYLLDMKENRRLALNLRVGLGYDVHRYEDGDFLILGGVKIPFIKSLKAHSDGDVLVHAIMDALLGAMGLGDIGKIFPDSDDTYKGISSMILLEQIFKIMKEKKYKIVNLDATIICEKPKMSQYIEDMKDNISAILEISKDRVNIKATTEEKLGFTGELKGIKSEAVVLLEGE